jgi:hypothetical protein
MDMLRVFSPAIVALPLAIVLPPRFHASWDLRDHLHSKDNGKGLASNEAVNSS